MKGNKQGQSALVDTLNKEKAKTAEAEKEICAQQRFLQIANSQIDFDLLLEEFADEIGDLTSCEAIGIRLLDEEGNIPYSAYSGFSQSFYEKESPLSIKSDQCMCINVVKGTTDPSLSFYSDFGSFYMNGTTKFLATVSEEEKGKTRNVCNAVGYESVALIPIRARNNILGLVHIADSEENKVPLKLVNQLERLSNVLGISIQRAQTHNTLKSRSREMSLANKILRVFVEETGKVMYDKALDIVLEGFASRQGVFGYIDEAGDLVCPTMTRMFDECNMEGKCIRYTRGKWKGLWSRALLTKKVLYTNKAPVVPEGHVPIKNNLAAPVLYHGEVIGLLNLANKDTAYTEDDRVLIEGVAGRVAPVLYGWIQKEMREDERKKAEEKLSYLASFPEFNPNPIFEIDLKGKVEYSNPACKKEFGDLSGKHPALTGYASILDELDRERKNFLNRDISVKDKYFQQTVHLVPDKSGLRFYNFDITGRKKAENLAQARYRIIEKESTSKSLDDFLRAIIDEIEQMTGSKIGFYHFVEEDQETLSLQEWSTNTLKTLCTAKAKGEHYAISEAGVWVDAVHERKPVIHNDYQSLPNKKGLPKGHAPVIREMVMPIIRGGKIMAVFGVGNKASDYTQADIETALFLGDFSWEIVERKRVEQRLSAERETLQATMESTITHFAYLDKDLNFILVNSAYVKGSGHTKEELIGQNHFKLFPNKENEEIFKKVRDSGKPFEFKAKPFEFVDQPWRGVTYWDWTLTPIKDSRSRVQGLVLSLVDVTENIRSKQLSDSLNEINEAIHSTLDFSRLMQTAVEKAAEALRAEGSGVAVHDEGNWRYAFTSGASNAIKNKTLSDEDAPTLTLISKTQKPLAINDVFNDKTTRCKMLMKQKVKSFLGIPLIAKKEVIGVLSFRFVSGIHEFTNQEIDFAKKLGNTLSLAIENAKLYEAEHKVSETLQEALLTAPKEIEGVELGYLYRSATEEARVGGDFYDVFELENNKIGVIVGDVSGKGLAAATLTSLVKNSIKAFTYQEGENSPAAIIAKTNEVIRKDTPAGVFVSVFFGVLDVKTGRLLYCNAGHPQPVLKRKTSRITLLKASSPVIGVIANPQFVDQKETIQKGESLVFYTDGITEARCDTNGFFGEERLIDFVRKADLPAKKLPQAIFKEVNKCTKGKLADDIVLLALSLK